MKHPSDSALKAAHRIQERVSEFYAGRNLTYNDVQLAEIIDHYTAAAIGAKLAEAVVREDRSGHAEINHWDKIVALAGEFQKATGE